MVNRSESWTSIGAMLDRNAAQFGSRPGILGGGGVALSHEALKALVASMVGSLKFLGIGRADRVAIVLPPGPDLAVAFLAIATGATSAPLNPAYLENEFEFHLRDLSSKAIVVLQGIDSPARAAAKRLGITVVELTPLAAGGGISGVPGATLADPALNFAQPEDVALVLHTSGTTSRPKRVR
jgi:acyl-coenzyme A synthetase/AMP-(fatty) acid ligase